MPFDGTTWDGAAPTNNDLANEIDDNMRDMKLGVQLRANLEHIWPATQTGTSEAGMHRFITMSQQTAAPSLVVGTQTQNGAIYISSSSLAFVAEDSAGNKYPFVASGKGLYAVGAMYSTTGTAGELVIGTSGGLLKILAPGSSGQILTATTTADVLWASNSAMFANFENYGATAGPGTTVVNTNAKVYFGRVQLSGASFTVTGLDFANATSYGISVIRTSTYHSEALIATSVGAASFVIQDAGANSDTVSWMAIGS